MKTKIRITGQTAGNIRLCLHLQSAAIVEERFFQDYILTFATKKEAKKAISVAYKNLKELEPDFYREGGINYFPGSRLFYDASTAKIL